MAPPASGYRRSPFAPVELHPGLVVRLLEESERAAHAADVARSGLYDHDPQSKLEGWWRSPDIWPTVVAWQGQILQYDYFHLLKERQVWAGLTLRPARDRAPWFWRWVRRPILERLMAAGYRTMVSAIRADRRDWIETMKAMWRAEETGHSANRQWVHLRYHLRTCLDTAAAPPPTRHLSGWAWERDGVRVREATEAELTDRIPLVVAEDWSGSPRAGAALALLNAGTALDRGTVLVTELDGRIRDIRLVRPRGLDGAGPVGGLITLTRMQPVDVGQLVAAEGLYRWAQLVGYEELVMWMPAAQVRLPGLMARLRRGGWRDGPVRRPGGHAPTHEFRLRLDEALLALEETACAAAVSWRCSEGAQ